MSDRLAAERISIHSLRVEGDSERDLSVRDVAISIHSLRVEGDVAARPHVAAAEISIHSLRVEGDFGSVRTTI